MKLRQQFSIYSGLLVIAIIISIFTAFIVHEKRLLTDIMRDREDMIFSGFSEMARESLGLDDELLLLNYINTTKRLNRNIEYMVFNSAEGYVLGNRDEFVPEAEQDGAEIMYSSPDGVRIRDLSEAVNISGRLAGTVQIGYSQDVLDEEVAAALRETIGNILLIALVALFLSLLASLLLSYKLSSPIKKLAVGASLIGEGDLDQRISIRGPDELNELASEFNSMALKLKELDEMKDHFISSVTHELKSPLSYIKGYIGLFLSENRDNLSGEHMEYFDIINRNITRLSGFITDVLDLAKLKSGQMQLNQGPSPVKDMAQEAVSFCSQPASEEGISVMARVPEGISDAWCDREKITQVLHNLVGNALKFTPEGGSITIAAEEAEDKIRVSVEDTGIGIPEDKLDAVFEKFQQVKENTDKVNNAKGTGLGLVIVKGIVEAHGESIRVESRLNEGTSFIFTLRKAGENGDEDEQADTG